MGKSRKKDLLTFLVLLFITILIMIYAIFQLINSFTDGEETILSYNENSSLNYKVWLKENEFYSTDYVGEDYNLVASSINEIEIDFDYLLNTSNYVTGKSYYTINSKIIAYQKDDIEQKKIWDNEKLIKDKIITVYDKETLNITAKDSFKINYDEYKKLMDDYKKKYAVSLVGNLIIDIEIKTDLTYEKFTENVDLETRKMTITIPLTESIVKITKNLSENANNSIIEKGDPEINYLKLSLSVFAFVGGIGMCVFLSIVLVKLLGYDSKYVRKLNNILKTYNSIIVTIDKLNFEKSKNIINVLNFDELLDAQSELRVPILYCNVVPNKESVFYIKYDKDILVYNLKSDLYEIDNKKKSKSDAHEKDKK